MMSTSPPCTMRQTCPLTCTSEVPTYRKMLTEPALIKVQLDDARLILQPTPNQAITYTASLRGASCPPRS